MISHARLSRIDTPSQQWAKEQHACSYGRRSLGTQSIADYYRTTTNEDHVVWIARHLTPRNLDNQSLYLLRADRCFYGRWAALHARRYMAKLFAEFDVQFPAACL